MFRYVGYLTSIVVVVASGYVQGVWTNRWTRSHEVEDAVARLNRIDKDFGDWSGKPSELDPRALKLAAIDGYVARNYENRRDGTKMMVLLVSGRPGPISLHTPDICYPGAGFEAVSDPVVEVLEPVPGATPARFQTTKFRNSGVAAPTTLRILWTWNATGTWQAPENPRLQFAPYKVLYKLYVIHEMSSTDEPREDLVCKQFISQLLPEFDRALFPHPARVAAIAR